MTTADRPDPQAGEYTGDVTGGTGDYSVMASYARELPVEPQTPDAPKPRIRYRRRDDGEREYDVLTQDQPGARWRETGRVAGFGEPPAWAALGTDAAAWTDYWTTRQAATADMLAGRTFLSGRPDALAETFAPDHAQPIAQQGLEAGQ